MSILEDKKEASLVTKGQFYVRYMGNLYLETRNKIFEFPIGKVSITLKSNDGMTDTTKHKHFTAYTSVMFDEFYEKLSYIDKAYLEWCIKNLEGSEDIERTEEIKYISNFKMKLDFDVGNVPIWRIDFDYSSY